jgi:hypothetical protein
MLSSGGIFVKVELIASVGLFSCGIFGLLEVDPILYSED